VLLDAGVEPRVDLRATPIEGVWAVRRALGTFLDVTGGEVPQFLPDVSVATRDEWSVGVPNGDGTAFVDGVTRIDAADNPLVDAALLASLQADLRPARALVSPNYEVLEGDLSTSGLAAVEANFTSGASDLPGVPVGVGARWESRSLVFFLGIRFDQVTSYELTAIDDGDVSITYTSSLTGVGGPLILPGSGEVLDITDVSGTVDGDHLIVPGLPVMLSYSITVITATTDLGPFEFVVTSQVDVRERPSDPG
jgi:hypothetical protein